MPQVIAEAGATPLGGWLLVIPLGLALGAAIASTLWFLRCSRGRRLVSSEPDDSDPVP